MSKKPKKRRSGVYKSSPLVRRRSAALNKELRQDRMHQVQCETSVDTAIEAAKWLREAPDDSRELLPPTEW
jgi:hypothetical protein